MAQRESDGPRVRVAALAMHEGRVLLVRHRTGQSTYHLLPGGGVDYRETLEDALVREVAEETGFEIEIGAPVLLSDTIDPHGPRHVVNIVFSASITGGTVTESPDDTRVEAAEFVELDQLLSLDLRPPCAQAIIDVARADTNTPARYLGSLFTEGR